MKFILLSFLLFFAVSCNSKKSESINFVEGNVLKSSKDFNIPKQLIGRIKKEYIAYIRELEPNSTATDEELVAQLPREFLEVDMYLSELYTGALLQNTVFRSPRGGGLVDLSDTVIGEKGSFFVRLEARNPDSPDQKVDNLKVYHIAEVRKKSAGDKVYGAGCGVLVDISSEVAKHKTSKGFLVNAKSGRYFHTIAGLYVFVNFGLEKIRLAALRVMDSSIKGYECPGKS